MDFVTHTHICLFLSLFSSKGCAVATSIDYPSDHAIELLQKVYTQFVKKHGSYQIKIAKEQHCLSGKIKTYSSRFVSRI